MEQAFDLRVYTFVFCRLNFDQPSPRDPHCSSHYCATPWNGAHPMLSARHSAI